LPSLSLEADKSWLRIYTDQPLGLYPLACFVYTHHFGDSWSSNFYTVAVLLSLSTLALMGQQDILACRRPFHRYSVLGNIPKFYSILEFFTVPHVFQVESPRIWVIPGNPGEWKFSRGAC